MSDATSSILGETRATSLFGDIRGISLDDRRLKGYAIVFNRLSKDLGGFRERILPEAVNRTLNSGEDVRALVEHDPKQVLARTTAGTLRMRPDGYGLFVEIDLPRTTVASDLIENIHTGNITGMSFRFMTSPSGAHLQYEGSDLIRTVSDMKFTEVSATATPAYPDTSIALRSVQDFLAVHDPKRSLAYLRRWHQIRIA